MVHISEMSWTRNVRHPSKLVALGDEVETVVLKVDPEGEKISLGMKQIEEDPWHTLPVKYPVGTRLTGKVRNLTSFGAFVEIEPGIDGLVHISDMSWTKRIQHPSEIVHKSDDVEVIILSIDAENKRISLGLKQTQEDPWEELSAEFIPGLEVSGTISRLQDKGVAVDLGNDIEGFVPLSQIGVAGLEDPADVFAEGDALDMQVTEVDPENRRIVLTVTNVPKFEGGEPVLPPRREQAEAPEAAPEAAPEVTDAVEASVAPEAAEAPEAAPEEARMPEAAPEAVAEQGEMPEVAAEEGETSEAITAEAVSEKVVPEEVAPEEVPAAQGESEVTA